MVITFTLYDLESGFFVDFEVTTTSESFWYFILSLKNSRDVRIQRILIEEL